MKVIKMMGLFMLVLLLFTACSSDDDQLSISPDDETEGLQLIQSFQDGDYTLDLFSKTGKLQVGYNKVYLQIEDADGRYVEDAQLSWYPMMTMEMHSHHKPSDHDDPMMHHHSCPNSEIDKTSHKNTLYEGYVVFVMASNDSDFWELNLSYHIAGRDGELAAKVFVEDLSSEYHQVFNSVMGSDGENYILALVEPEAPKVGINPMEVALFKSAEEGMHFPLVNDYRINVDPRMPGMGNHSATGSEDLTQNANGFYEGKVAFSMTGYWKINLILQNESGEILKGEKVTNEHPESSLHFKLEF